MKLIDGKYTASQIKQEIAATTAQYLSEGYRAPKLVAVLVGHDGGSETYVNSKMRSCAECGFLSEQLCFESDITESELLNVVDKLNTDDSVDGFIVQLPLPKHIDTQKVIERISPEKDVDGFTPENIGKMAVGLPSFVPATPLGILELLKRYEIETGGKRCVILGRSNIVGKPLSILMMRKGYPGNATVTVAHSASENINELCREADILIAAIGVPGFVRADMVKTGAVVIDVGTTRVADNTKKSGFRLSGDVDFESVAPKCSFITPVPGGVGPMTIASLMMNTLSAYRKKFNLKDN